LPVNSHRRDMETSTRPAFSVRLAPTGTNGC
jgi:hypothetical protein